MQNPGGWKALPYNQGLNMIDQFTQIKLFPDRVSETDSVPLKWAIAELTRLAAKIPKEYQDNATLHGWTGIRAEYTHRRSPLEVEQARSKFLIDGLYALLTQGGATKEQLEELFNAGTK